MPVYRPRTRLVNFRLSEDEYKTLKDISAASGARSVSDYARAAVLAGTSLPDQQSPFPLHRSLGTHGSSRAQVGIESVPVD